MTDPANQPAVIKGQPAPIDRLRRRMPLVYLAEATAVTIAWLLWSRGTNAPAATLPAFACMCAGGLTFLFLITIGISRSIYGRIESRLHANPHACLHCLYPLEPTTPHCPECGRLNNRQDLNQEWQQIIKQGERSSD